MSKNTSEVNASTKAQRTSLAFFCVIQKSSFLWINTRFTWNTVKPTLKGIFRSHKNMRKKEGSGFADEKAFTVLAARSFLRSLLFFRIHQAHTPSCAWWGIVASKLFFFLLLVLWAYMSQALHTYSRILKHRRSKSVSSVYTHISQHKPQVILDDSYRDFSVPHARIQISVDSTDTLDKGPFLVFKAYEWRKYHWCTTTTARSERSTCREEIHKSCCVNSLTYLDSHRSTCYWPTLSYLVPGGFLFSRLSGTRAAFIHKAQSTGAQKAEELEQSGGGKWERTWDICKANVSVICFRLPSWRTRRRRTIFSTENPFLLNLDSNLFETLLTKNSPAPHPRQQHFLDKWAMVTQTDVSGKKLFDTHSLFAVTILDLKSTKFKHLCTRELQAVALSHFPLRSHLLQEIFPHLLCWKSKEPQGSSNWPVFGLTVQGVNRDFLAAANSVTPEPKHCNPTDFA